MKAECPIPVGLSVVIPTLNAASHLPAALRSLAGEGPERLGLEIVVSDGGSADGTQDIARAHGALVLESEPGRGAQLHAGAARSSGEFLLFLHADTRLAREWPDAVTAFAGDPGSEGRAGYFRFALDDDAPSARRLVRMVGWRCRRFGLPYGDQGLLVSRALYERAGGYRALPLMEDVDLVRRIGRGRMQPLAADAVTSAARYRRDGYLARSARNLFCLSLYGLGVPPRILTRIYG